MKIKHILLVLTPCIIAFGCKKQDIKTWESEMAGIFFQRVTAQLNNITYFTDTLRFSFAAGPATNKDTILKARVLTMGKVRDYNRPFKVSADTGSTALEGTHYEIVHSLNVVPAGAAEAYAHVKVYRTSDLSKQTFRLMLKLEENEHFKPHLETQARTDNYSSAFVQLNARRYRIDFDDMITKPDSWRWFGEFWGQPWSLKKYTFINSVVGWTHYDWTVGYDNKRPPIEYRYMGPAAARVRDSLQVLKNAGTPLLDEDGTPMKLSSQYPVR